MRRVVLLSSAIVFVDTLFYALLTPLLPHYAHHYGLSKAGVGILAAAYPAGVLVGSIPSGWVAGRIGVKATAIGGLLIVAATSVVFGFGGSIVLLDLARFVQGIGSAFAWTASLTWLVALSAPGRRGALLGQTISVAIVGALFGPALGGVASVVGTGPTFTAVAALALVVAVFALRTEAPAQGPNQPVRRLLSALRDRPLLTGLWLIALPALLFGTTIVLVPAALLRPRRRRRYDRRRLRRRGGAGGDRLTAFRTARRSPRPLRRALDQPRSLGGRRPPSSRGPTRSGCSASSPCSPRPRSDSRGLRPSL